MQYSTIDRINPRNETEVSGLLLEHFARYYFSTPYIHGGRVLDFGCGSGYGSQMIAKILKKEIEEIVAVDINLPSITEAKAYYYHPLVRFLHANCVNKQLPTIIGKFKTILSFQTIEYIQDQTTFMENVDALLEPGGTFVLSTSLQTKQSESSLVRPLAKQRFTELFTAFSQVEFYYQRGVTIEKQRDNTHYPIGIAVCRK
ncbi:class I SAM-dependent methyltransferase [Alkalihalobacillus sp. LMS39]|uniref:class I SAM-dependent methyltransferase n=1 Tax=Alkalihalobacillus sp. LMS39 TaxID=2924032 RepID=UPI001FB30A40|nr:class I SAM-dependent methyltransferase [Alkalihalobacillus sp. LMS39]UOE93767.1 class I SAM-dependent methyltransferase [Alkalihalobacillus sp. LMS39]